jgi:HNH endonuclease
MTDAAPAPTSESEAVTGAEGDRRDRSEADTTTVEAPENRRALLYQLQGATSGDADRDGGRFRPGDETARFWSQVDRSAGCWLWTGHRNSDGYGQFKVTVQAGRYRTVRAHRWAWQATHGPVPAGLTLDHLCGQTACVRPEHLEPCTNAENLRRRHARRRAQQNGATS